MDPEATLKNILDLFDAVSNSDLDERDLGEELTMLILKKKKLWDLKYAVSDYSDWIKKDGFSPNFQNVVKEWLTDKESQAYDAPDKNQKQFWDDSAL